MPDLVTNSFAVVQSALLFMAALMFAVNNKESRLIFFVFWLSMIAGYLEIGAIISTGQIGHLPAFLAIAQISCFVGGCVGILRSYGRGV